MFNESLFYLTGSNFGMTKQSPPAIANLVLFEHPPLYEGLEMLKEKGEEHVPRNATL